MSVTSASCTTNDRRICRRGFRTMDDSSIEWRIHLSSASLRSPPCTTVTTYDPLITWGFVTDTVYLRKCEGGLLPRFFPFKSNNLQVSICLPLEISNPRDVLYPKQQAPTIHIVFLKSPFLKLLFCFVL